MSTIQSILALVDLSESSNNTITAAASMASKFGAKLNIYHASPNISEQQRENLETEFEGLLNEVLNSGNTGAIKHRTLVAKEDFPKGALMSDLVSDADLVVVGTRMIAGKPSKRERIQEMIENMDPPVLVVPQDRGIGQMEFIMYCSSYDELTSDLPLNLIKDMASRYNSEVRVAHVKTGSGNPNSNHVERSREEGSFFEPEVKYSYKLIRSADVIDGIQHYIRKKGDNDMLVMVKRNHRVLGRIFGKKYTFKMLHQTTIPMLIIKEPQLN